MPLSELATVIRSKNAGPRLLTIDIMFSSNENFDRARLALPKLRGRLAYLYGVAEQTIQIIDYPPSNSIKIVMPRPVMSGNRDDRDVYGAQQHAPLLGLQL